MNSLSARLALFHMQKPRRCMRSRSSKRDVWKSLNPENDQLDIVNGKGMVPRLFQGEHISGTHNEVLSTYDYKYSHHKINKSDINHYISPSFQKKVSLHITKNFIKLNHVNVPLILGIWGKKGMGKTFQTQLVLDTLGCTGIMMSAGELESEKAGEPAKLLRTRYLEAGSLVKKGQLACLVINDLDAGNTQYTVNNQMVNSTLMNIAENPTNVQMNGSYINDENPRVPIIVTGNDFSSLYSPLIRDGRMEKFYWEPTRDDIVGIVKGIFERDHIKLDVIKQLITDFNDQSIDFFAALRCRIYDSVVYELIEQYGISEIGKTLVNSKSGLLEIGSVSIDDETLFNHANDLKKEQFLIETKNLTNRH